MGVVATAAMGSANTKKPVDVRTPLEKRCDPTVFVSPNVVLTASSTSASTVWNTGLALWDVMAGVAAAAII